MAARNVSRLNKNPIHDEKNPEKNVLNNNVLELFELESFDESPISGGLFSLNDLVRFEYVLGTTSSIEFSARKRVDINKGSLLYNEYFLQVASLNSALAIYTYLSSGNLIIGDGFNDQPVRVTATAIPEPFVASGVLCALAWGQAFKRKTQK